MRLVGAILRSRRTSDAFCRRFRRRHCCCVSKRELETASYSITSTTSSSTAIIHCEKCGNENWATTAYLYSTSLHDKIWQAIYFAENFLNLRARLLIANTAANHINRSTYSDERSCWRHRHFICLYLFWSFIICINSRFQTHIYYNSISSVELGQRERERNFFFFARHNR